ASRPPFNVWVWSGMFYMLSLRLGKKLTDTGVVGFNGRNAAWSRHWGCHRRTRRSSFCLYQSEYIQQPQLHSTTRSALQPGRTDQQQQSHDDCKLQDAAREARERLDERLRTTSLPSNRRRGSFWCRNSSKQTCDSDPRGGNCQEEVWPSSIRGWFSSAASVNGARRSAAESIKHDVLKQTSSLGVSKASIDLLHREAFTSANKDSGKYSWKSLNVKNSQQGLRFQ
ncbi:hypothetical protein SUGI_0898110, partial [Cryptomeria japonica]